MNENGIGIDIASDTALKEVANQLGQANVYLAAIAAKDGGSGIKDWATLQSIIRAGLAPRVLAIGDQLECQRNGETIVWDVIGIDHDTPANPNLKHSVTLQMHEIWKNLQYDAPEALYYCREELAAGAYHFTLLSGYDTAWGGGKTLSFTLTKNIPAGGVIMFPWGYEKQAADTKISTYSSRESTEAIETVTVDEASTGIFLGTADGKSENMNHTHRIRYGSNNYAESAARQCLNSDKAAGTYWKPQTIFDRPPTWETSQEGFMAGMDEDFLAVVAETSKTTALNTVTDGGGSTETTDKFFLLSKAEVYAGAEGSIMEGEPYPFYSDFSDLSQAGTGEDTNRIKYTSAGTAGYWRLRSPHVGIGYNVRAVYPTGAVHNYTAINADGLDPACILA